MTPALAAKFRAVRAQTLALAVPLSAEDAMLQSMPDASPAKWHLAHSTWFFEQFMLAADSHYTPFDTDYARLFNSYYESVGPRHARPQRGLLSRPTLAEVLTYRGAIDARVDALLSRTELEPVIAARIVLGLEHEQQHQELLLTDIKHAFWTNPLRPAYRTDLVQAPAIESTLRWHVGAVGAIEIGADAWPDAGKFAFDHESPRHRHWLAPHALAHRPVNNAEYREFVRAGGYRTPTLWLSAGWDWVREHAIEHPLYWDEASEMEFTLGGPRALDPHRPVVHVSYFEADAFARWSGARLPTEAEWERAAQELPVAGNFLESDALHTTAAAKGDATAPLVQLFGDVWEWTASAYLSYPGFRPLEGALGEYNGKFMSGQFVLRGGSCASPLAHLRASYRNFFAPEARWQFSGIRLARDL